MFKRLSLVALAAIAAATPAFSYYNIDDGVSENSVGIGGTNPTSIYWANNFVTEVGCETIMNVQGAFGTPLFPDPSLNGMSVLAFVMRANPDGTPMQGGLLASVNGVIAMQGTDLFETFDTPDVTLNVGDRFLVGFVHNRLGAVAQFPAAIDSTAVPLSGRSYAAFLAGAGNFVDPNNINGVPAGQKGYIEAFGLPGNWLVRAECTAVPEPATFVALGAALLGLAVTRRRK